ncbi:type VII secretion protein EccB [Streptomyces boncukensis]|uniref:Type VII secretion protein EccB n=1 Tax=Streptomyces boncukensis TaxID=2711219 RepID=A0A6G4X4P1_9ACTN|nr:type VII secretion protein EccB [Streptomyces boncukensis]NGO71631.1 type VII secretion protein EccB [Streptomyces boncukensis]
MASRRDELNAYTFAKKRLVASFLQPSPTGTEEGAPRPLRGILPGLIIGVVIMAGFGAWGMFKPKAPDKWDEPGEKVIIGSESTTRYVVLKTGDSAPQLHPVLNLTSAKLLLAPDKGDVVKVDEKVLDKGDIPHGATLGIPYAPDRLPSSGEAGDEKRWAVCESPSQGGRAVQKSTFVLADRDKDKVEGPDRLRGGELLYVQGPDDKLYVVDRTGRKYRLMDGDELLLRLVTDNRKPQRVSRQWLATLHTGDLVGFPTVPGTIGAPAGVDGLPPNANRVGMVLRAASGTEKRHYVVLHGRVRPITDFMAHLLLNSRQLSVLKQGGDPMELSAGNFVPARRYFGSRFKWPTQRGEPVNAAGRGNRDTVCNVLRKVGRNGVTTLSTWAGEDFPAELPAGATSAYVTPGTGQLFRQVKGKNTKAGGVFLVTDTGLRYAMQGNSDSAQDDAGIGRKDGTGDDQQNQNQSGNQNERGRSAQQPDDEDESAQQRLGYAKVKPAPIPAEWSQFLPTGPRLATSSARQPQGS